MKVIVWGMLFTKGFVVQQRGNYFGNRTQYECLYGQINFFKYFLVDDLSG